MMKFLTFAYGSNMHQGDLDRWLNEKGYSNAEYEIIGKAILKDFSLVFNYESTSRNCGVANIIRSEGSLVEGLLIEGNQEFKKALRRKEGFPYVYDEICVSVILEGGKKICCTTYQVVNGSKEHIKPSKSYLGLIVDSARKYGFSSEYIAKLKLIKVQ